MSLRFGQPSTKRAGRNLMVQDKRPRVAAIGINGARFESISHLCGELRQADTLEEYLQQYNWIETDIVLAEGLQYYQLNLGVNLVVMGQASLTWGDTHPSIPGRRDHNVNTDNRNTERELRVPHTCPEIYKELAVQLSTELMASDTPPATFVSSRRDKAALVETTSGKSAAMRIALSSARDRWRCHK